MKAYERKWHPIFPAQTTQRRFETWSKRANLFEGILVGLLAASTV